MAIYLVDYENRSGKGTESGLFGIEKLGRSDTVVVFLGKTSLVPAEQLAACVNKSVARVIFHKCRKVARNYLDFQLVTYLGYLVGTTAEREFYLVTADKGFGAAVDYWLAEHPEVSIIMQTAIAPQPAAVRVSEQPPSKQKKKRGKAAAAGAAPGTATAGASPAAAAAPAMTPAPGAPSSAPAADTATLLPPAIEASAATQALAVEAAPTPAFSRKADKTPATAGAAPATAQDAPSPARTGINKTDPPESLRKVARTIYKSAGIKMGYIAQLYDAMRESPSENVFTTRLRNLYGALLTGSFEDDLLDLFARYQTLRNPRPQ